MPMFANVAAVSVFMMQASGIDLIQGPLALLFKEMSLVQHSKYHECTLCRGIQVIWQEGSIRGSHVATTSNNVGHSQVGHLHPSVQS